MKRFYLPKLIILTAMLCGLSRHSQAQTTTYTFNGVNTMLGGAGTGGTPQAFIVPPGVSIIGIDMYGASGGFPCCSWTTAGSGPIAQGGRVQCTMNVTPGTTLWVYVGGHGGDNYDNGTSSPPGWNGGGQGGAAGSAFCASGGGASDIRTINYVTFPATTYPAGVLVVAGAGGGGGDFGPVGGLGGGAIGGTGGGGACGGAQTGPSCTTGSVLGTPGQGGATNTYSEGGGGGGWWGGNGANGDDGGGGGSSYPATATGAVTAITHTQGYAAAINNGQVIITVLCNGAGAITGTGSACAGSTTTLTAAAASAGTWSSGNTAIASIASTGVVTGVSPGTAVITYTVPNACGGVIPATTTVTINQTPTPITGTASVCDFVTTNLGSTPTTGTWTSSNNGLATVSGGVVTGVSAGTPIITYTLPDGCLAITPVVVNSGPAPITGTAVVCASGATVSLGEVSTGGTWSSSLGGVATISPTGVLTGVVQGNTTIAYTFVSTGCVSSVVATVNALPLIFPVIATAPAGFSSSAYCAGSTSTISIELGSSTSGVSYQLFDLTTAGTTPFPAIISTGGLLNFGIESNIGTYSVIATTPQGCFANMSGTPSISITPLPPVLSVSAANGGLYCASGSGVSITVGASTAPLDNYKLYNGTSLVATATGTATSLTFPGLFSSGSYTVIASDATTNHCSSTMNGGIAVNIISEPVPGPQTITVENGGFYCSGGAGVHVGLAFSNSGVEYSLYNGTAFVDSAAGSNSGLDFGLQTATGTYTVVGVNSGSGCSSSMPGSITVAINSLPNLYPLTGGGNYCPGSAGVPIGVSGSDVGTSYQLYDGTATVGGPVTGAGLGFNFGIFNTSGSYSVVATSPAGCTSNLGSLIVSANAVPTIYPVTGGGPFCAGSGGVDIMLGGGDIGVTYQLYVDGSMIGPLQTGAGASIDFGNFTTAGIYTVVANNGSCTGNMTGYAVIIVNPLPDVHNVTGGGGYCANLTGRHVGLDFSDVGVKYQLWNITGPVGAPVSGSGSGLDFGIEPTGDYTVVATNFATGCTISMNGSALVTENALPNPYNVTGTGDYCAGGIGENLGLDGSDYGVNYELYLGTTPVGGSVGGSGEGGVDFGNDTAAGTYTVIATNPSTGCTSTMTGNAVITIDPLPVAYILSAPGGNSYCSGSAGIDLILTGSAAGINYQLFNAGIGGAIFVGTGTSIDFGLVPAGEYIVTATNPATTCNSNMTGSVNVNILPLPNSHNITGGGNYCMGGTGSPVGLDGSDAGNHYQLLVGGSPIGGAQPGTGAPLNFGLRTPVGSYTIVATNPVTTCTVDMEGSVMINTISLPGIYPVGGGGAYCAGSSAPSVTLPSSDEGVTYILYLGSTLIDSLIPTPSGSPVNFGTEPLAGTYTVVGVGSTDRCSQNMSGNAVVTVNSVNAYPVIGGGTYCLGGTGVHIGQSSSGAGVSYQLVNTVNIGSPVTGTGGPIDFGLDTLAGTYTVVGTNLANGCSGNMEGSATVIISPLPPIHAVTGFGSFCVGSPLAIPVTLSGSDEDIDYQVYFGSTPIGGVVIGTGGSGVTGLTTGLDSGAYTVVATNPSTGCKSTMSGTATLTVKPLPIPYPVTSENYGNYCSGDTGVHVGLLNSTAGVEYYIHGGSSTRPIYDSLMGTGSALDFGLETVAGVYLVTGSQSVTSGGCNNTMAGGAYVYIIPLPIVHNVTGTGGYCPGGAGVDVGLDGSQAGIYYQLYDAGVPVGGSIYGSGVALNFGVQPAGTYTIIGSSEVIAMGYVTTCPNPMFGSAVVSVDSLQTPTITLKAYPGPGVGVWHVDSMKVFVTNGGTNPTFQWYVNGNIISGATSATFSNYAFFNGDSVSCQVAASGPCGGLSTVESIVLALHNVGVTQVTSAGSDVKLVPNPNNGTFTVKGTLGVTADEEVTLEVTNMLGQVVYTDKVMTQGGNINAHIELANSLANGMYIMTLHSGTQNNVIHFVIEQ